MQQKLFLFFFAAVPAFLLIFLSACTSSTSAQANNPRNTAEVFYRGWVNADTSEIAKDSYAEAKVTSGFRTRLDAMTSDSARYASLTCVNGVFTSADFVSMDIDENQTQATILLSAHANAEVVPVTVRVVKTDGVWRVDNVNCPNGTNWSSSSMSSDSSNSSSSNSNSSMSSMSSSMSSSSMRSSSSMSSAMSSSSSSVTPRPTAGEGAFCGGIAGIMCNTGLHCQYEGTYPDAGGVCVR